MNERMNGFVGMNLISPLVLLKQVLRDYNGKAVDLSKDFTVAASNVITTLTFGKSVNDV